MAGLCKVLESDVVDPTQFDPASDYFDEKSTPESPRWQTVKVAFVEKFPRIITLEELKRDFAAEELVVVRKGNRLSVMPVSEEAAEKLLRIARAVG